MLLDQQSKLLADPKHKKLLAKLKKPSVSMGGSGNPDGLTDDDKIEATLEALKARAVKLPAEITTALKTAIADARAKIDDAKLFEKVQAAYRMVVEYPTVVAVIEKTAPVAAKAVDVAGPYYVKAKTIAEPYVVKGMEIAGPYVAAVKARVLPKTVEQID